MHVILGATGHVGSAVAMALLDHREPVTVVTRDERRAEPFTPSPTFTTLMPCAPCWRAAGLRSY
jgi:uncharacterized protein YbjT (DUF2867 family)